jgi:hypothetical protein
MLDSLLSPLPATKIYVDNGSRPVTSYTAGSAVWYVDWSAELTYTVNKK